MGRFIKIALALFLIGLGIVAVVVAVSDENPFNIDETEFEKVEYSYEADDLNSFDLNFENRSFYIKESLDGQIKIEYYVNEKETVTVNDNDLTLEITHEVDWVNQIFSWFNYLGDNDFYDVYIYLPTSVTYDVMLHTSNGILEIYNLDNIGVLTFSSSNGRIDLENVEADNIDVATSNGRIELANVTVAENIRLDTSNGKIKLNNVVAGKDVSADTSNGDVTVAEIIAEDIELETSNGSIDVSLYGDKDDYKLIAGTSNGDIDYDGLGITGGVVNSSGIYVLDVDTSNGNITITFLD